jgi:hypothetical protein
MGNGLVKGSFYRLPFGKKNTGHPSRRANPVRMRTDSYEPKKDNDTKFSPPCTRYPNLSQYVIGNLEWGMKSEE